MQPTSNVSAANRRWTRTLAPVVALGIAIPGLTGDPTSSRSLLVGVREVSAAPATTPPAALPPSPVVPPAAHQSRRFQGRVLDDGTGQPLRGASVWFGAKEVLTDSDGRFSLEASTGRPLTATVKLPGYERRLIDVATSETTIRLRPHAVKAAYLTYYGIGDRQIRERVLELAGRTELNAVVIDVKGDRGLIPYRTEVPLALEAGAQGPVIIKDFDTLLASLKAQGIYTIARIVVFKDTVLANHRKDLAIIDTRTRRPWVDNEKLAWVDPFRQEVWNYVIAIAKEAAAKGFDEIQFDYVRFPTDGRLSVARYSRPNNSTTRLPTIAAFLAKARRELGPTGVFVAADLFGYTAFNTNDTDIGQRIEELAPHLDYICPMVYPSGYHLGIPGYRNPVAHPYEIVRESVRLIRQRSQQTTVQVRPWLQDFRDYAYDRRIFGVREIRAQIRGAAEAGSSGWMLWNPRNDYTGEALLPKSKAFAAVKRHTD
ncbi:MAG TPA: putative glycoside hydrolase [Candidatus Methylomirabilis sp.]|nr:putative glycoside hydrolase [Candidatus Methylomirabilis sp.]